MDGALPVLGIIAVSIYIVMTFLRLKLSTIFLDFTVFIISIIVAIALTLVPTVEDSLLSFTTFLYINALWLYGVERKNISKKSIINPSLPRTFTGFVLVLIATWISFSKIDVRVAAIAALSLAILGAYRLKTIEKKT